MDSLESYELPQEIIGIILLKSSSLYFAAAIVSKEINRCTQDYLYQKYLTRPFSFNEYDTLSNKPQFVGMMRLETIIDGVSCYEIGLNHVIRSRNEYVHMKYEFSGTPVKYRDLMGQHLVSWHDSFRIREQKGDSNFITYEHDLLTSYYIILERMKKVGKVNTPLAKSIIFNTYRNRASQRFGKRKHYYISWCVTNLFCLSNYDNHSSNIVDFRINASCLENNEILERINEIGWSTIEDKLHELLISDEPTTYNYPIEIIDEFFIKGTVVTEISDEPIVYPTVDIDDYYDYDSQDY